LLIFVHFLSVDNNLFLRVTYNLDRSTERPLISFIVVD